jgi:CRP/FNR family cyclic AMP-dependent transcriptional regulator
LGCTLGMSVQYKLRVIESCITCKLREDRLFCNLHGEALTALDSLKFSASYPAGAVLFREGDIPQALMILCQGKAKLSAASSEGKVVILNIAEPGEVLGLSSVISGHPHETMAETLEPAQLDLIRREDFLKFLQRFPEVGVHAARELSEVHNRACTELRLLGLAQSVPQKLAVLLLQWNEKAPPNLRGRLKLSLTQEELGQLLGTSRESIARALGELRRQKIVSARGATLNILNEPGLRRIAGI